MEKSLSKIGKLIDELRDLLKPEDFEKAIVFGSSAIVLNGVDLGRIVDDLDIFVSEELFKKLKGEFGAKEKKAKEGGTIPYVSPGQGIEILSSFPGMDFEIVAKNSVRDEVHGISIGSLSDLREWKVEQNREKDRQDIAAIDEYLGKSLR